MSNIGKPERDTQNRVAAFFVKKLGYRHLGDWTDRPGNSNIEEGILGEWLKQRGESAARIAKAIGILKREADHAGRGLYANNQAVYSLLRYGIPVQTEAGENHETVHLIDWQNPEANDFALAEEVTLKGKQERRPDIVVYVNGIAIAVLELKNSRVSIGDGIRQNLSNQQAEFNAWFFSTVQLILAGNDSEGLRYGTILTPEKYFLKWKEDEQENSGYKLDKYLEKICRKDRLIELVHDFILFDDGVKKVPRVHQYFGIKAAQENVRRREGGIIWHTQGSGKSIVMVLLAKWILENNPKARVAIITDRDELDIQIEQRLHRREPENPPHQQRQGFDVEACATAHRGSSARSSTNLAGRMWKTFNAFIKELESQPCQTVGEVFVFVDECHRTQSGKLHRVMKAMMPKAVFIGFSGTPLLKQRQARRAWRSSAATSTPTSSAKPSRTMLFWISIYEARDIDQRLVPQEQGRCVV
jgi:type I restriction enzyme R subunit